MASRKKKITDEETIIVDTAEGCLGAPVVDDNGDAVGGAGGCDSTVVGDMDLSCGKSCEECGCGEKDRETADAILGGEEQSTHASDSDGEEKTDTKCQTYSLSEAIGLCHDGKTPFHPSTGHELVMVGATVRVLVAGRNLPATITWTLAEGWVVR